jgi:digeranylgeranylglycerophospholipid reductase
MKVGIIGGGLAGLSCAHELERYGIEPVVFERNTFIGEPYSHVAVIVKVNTRPIRDVLKLLRKKYEIDIKPISVLKEIVHKGPSNISIIRGNLGYMLNNTNDEESLKNQIYKTLKKTDFRLGNIADFMSISEQFDHVVIATGNSIIAEELGCWQEWVDTYAKGGTVLGKFKTDRMYAWFNKDYCKNGYAYLTPLDEKKAVVILVVTDVNEKEVEFYWEQFLYTENIRYTIVEEFKYHHKTGYVYPLIVKNMIFTGNAAGGIDPFLGFGLYNAVSMGIAAATTIASGKDYEKQVEKIQQKNINLYEMRKMFNIIGNRDIDNIITLIGLPVVKQILYNTNYDISKFVAALSKKIINKRLNI